MLQKFQLSIFLTQNTWNEIKEELGEEATKDEITNYFCMEYKEIVVNKWSVPKEVGGNTFNQHFCAKECDYVRYQDNAETHEIKIHNFEGLSEKNMKFYERRYRETNVISIDDPVLNFERIGEDSPWAQHYFFLWIGAVKSFEFNRIMVNSNYDVGQYAYY